MKVWIAFQTRWREMRKMHQAQWPPGWATPLVGYPGILEMKLKVSQHQYRPLFILGRQEPALSLCSWRRRLEINLSLRMHQIARKRLGRKS